MQGTNPSAWQQGVCLRYVTKHFGKYEGLDRMWRFAVMDTRTDARRDGDPVYAWCRTQRQAQSIADALNKAITI
jgi:hypothetical protein